MPRYTWMDMIREELPIDIRPVVTCSVRVQDDLVRALECLGYAVTEAKVKHEIRWLYLVYVQYMLMHAVAMCDEEFAEMIKGKTPEEIEKESNKLMAYLRKKWLIR